MKQFFRSISRRTRWAIAVVLVIGGLCWRFYRIPTQVPDGTLFLATSSKPGAYRLYMVDKYRHRVSLIGDVVMYLSSFASLTDAASEGTAGQVQVITKADDDGVPFTHYSGYHSFLDLRLSDDARYVVYALWDKTRKTSVYLASAHGSPRLVASSPPRFQRGADMVHVLLSGPSISADNTLVTYLTLESAPHRENEGIGIWCVDLKSGRVWPIFHKLGGRRVGSVVILPEQRSILYRDGSSICQVDLDGKNRKTLLNVPHLRNFRLSRSGKSLLYSVSYRGADSLWRDSYFYSRFQSGKLSAGKAFSFSMPALDQPLVLEGDTIVSAVVTQTLFMPRIRLRTLDCLTGRETVDDFNG